MKKKNILVVDNSHLMVELMRNLLEVEGHYVVTAGDGLEALDILKTFVPEVIFIDLVMPSIDGKKLCQIIQRMPKLKDSYRVIVSAIAAEDPLDAAALGAHALIAKGRFSDIAEHVLAAVEQSEQRRPEKNREVMRFETVAPREITRELLSANKHFEIILERMAEGIIEITAGGRIVYANPIALAIIGLSEETLLGMQFCDLFAEGDRQRIKELVMRR
ncbi:MAG: response regulator, partial [Deltaproteobacteria bacterium]|nr:response regulator [Deltaproteobacteria bacterium]